MLIWDGMVEAFNMTPCSTVPVRGRPVLLLEFNELSPTLINQFIASGRLPNFARLFGESQAYVTDAEEAAPNLEPWIQWVTVHCGRPFDDHGIFLLGDGHKLKHRCIWDLASEAGLPVWVCGSMNIRYDADIRGAVLPDPWSLNTRPYPESTFAPYFNFVQRNVQEYTNDNLRLAKSDYLRFLQFMVTHGLSIATSAAIVRQLWTERLTGKYRWKRAAILDRLQWDVFKWFYKRINPALSTFFINSTAHLQHMYWRNMDPSPFKVKPSEEDQQEYEDAVLFGYEQMDQIVGEALELAAQSSVLILASALGQQPCLTYEDTGGKTFYRPRVFEKLLEYAGVTSKCTIAPVMAEEFQLHFESPVAAQQAATKLAALKVEGRKILRTEGDSESLTCGCSIFDQLSNDVLLERADGKEPWPFFRVFYQVEGLKSGMHHPDGILWMRIPGSSPRQHDEKVPLRDLPPTILAILGLEKPDDMTGRALPVQSPFVADLVTE